MPKLSKSHPKISIKSTKRTLFWLWHRFASYWQKNIWHKFIVVLAVIILLAIGTMYGIARWYMYSVRNQPYVMGVTFVPDYAASLGLNPEQTLSALINDLHVKNFRFTSYWSDIEPTPGHYDFSELDSEFAQADAAHATVSLSIGLRQPRWPECHAPSWVDTSAPVNEWQPELEQFMTAVINRYKNNPALVSYQLENEYFNKVFGTCTNYSRSRLVSEYNLVKKLDPNHPIIINRSNNAIGTPLGVPTPDEFGVSIYRRVWSTEIGRYATYPFPAWYYAFLAGVQKIINHKDMVIDELQAEPWAPNGKTIPEISLNEQNKSLNATSLQERFNFAKATGIRTVYFWGAEYWYYRLTVEHDPSVWNVAKQNFAKNT
jgi:hypothetical protein